MFTIVLFFHLLVVVSMIIVVLIQRSEGGGFTSANIGVSSSRGVSDFLTRSTSILAVLFFMNSIALSIIVRDSLDTESVVLEHKTPSGVLDNSNIDNNVDYELNDLENNLFFDDDCEDFIPKVEIPMAFN